MVENYDTKYFQSLMDIRLGVLAFCLFSMITELGRFEIWRFETVETGTHCLLSNANDHKSIGV
jgi:hypothetical protein